MKTYAGVGGVAKLAQRMYAGINGVAANVLKAYIGDENGKAKLWFSSLPSVTWQASNYYEGADLEWKRIYSMCYADGNLLACGNGCIEHWDGERWINGKYSDGNWIDYGCFMDICAHDGVVVAVCEETQSNTTYGGIYYSTDGGLTFTQRIATAKGAYWGFVKYLNGRWIAGLKGGFYHSADGINWTKVTTTSSTGASRDTLDAFYDDAKGMWILNCSDCYYKSSNGTSWSRADGAYGYRFKNGNNIIVVYRDRLNRISYSTDGGTTLTESTFEEEVIYEIRYYTGFEYSDSCGVCFADGKWVLGSESGLIYSEDLGATWKKCKAPKIRVCEVRHSDGVWMATGYDSYILYSYDGITWFNAVLPLSKKMFCLSCIDGKWMVGGRNGLLYCDSFIGNNGA